MGRFFDWFNSLQQREQLIVAVGAPVILFLLGYLWLWEPTVIERAKVKSQLVEERSFNQWLNQKSAQLLNNGKGATKQQSLATLVEATLLERTLSSYTRRIFKDSNGNTVAQLENIPYMDFNSWVLALQTEYSVILVSVTITAAEVSGYVNVRLTMSDVLPPIEQ